MMPLLNHLKDPVQIQVLYTSELRILPSDFR